VINRSQSDRQKFFWKVLGMYAPNVAAILHGEGIDSVKNTIFLTHDLHVNMGSLNMWFEATEEKDTYLIQTALEDMKDEFQLPEKIKFVNKDPKRFHDLPSPYILKVHAALCRVLHMSGAAEYIGNVLDDFEQIDCKALAADGSSAIEAYFLVRGM
jgi:hypothetical protein